MQLKSYQEKALRTLDLYLDGLRSCADEIQTARAALLGAGAKLSALDLDFPAKAWEMCRVGDVLPHSSTRRRDGSIIQYRKRADGIGRPVPDICLKVPTGGGKTLLGAWGTVAILQKFLRSNRGFVLWIVPNDAIYWQTRKQLTDRDHPYRQVLDRAAAGADRVRILEKDDPLNADDVREHLCVMLLMLQSANRSAKEQLRLFRDRGNVHGFFPLESDSAAHWRMLGDIPNLDAYGGGKHLGDVIKDSLGNVLRLLRPVVVLDEGHRAYSRLALDTLSGFNPCFVLELSATPPEQANKLIDVSGRDLEREEMIKLPINVEVRAGWDWRRCLAASWERINSLHNEAERLRANANRYIRPILLVQVERTGREQRDPKFVHALDAKEYLQTLGLAESEIAIKTAEVNDLKDPLNQNLLSPANQIRAIITKHALQEGWDCPFAYVLCSLATSHNLSGMTQLVGRILRQPEARKTGVPALDQCYVFCHNVETSAVVECVKKGLESDGMGELAGRIRTDGNGTGRLRRTISRRDEFQTARIFLPRVLWAEGCEPRDLDYERDILFNLDWKRASLDACADSMELDTHALGSATVQLGLELLSDPSRSSLRPAQWADLVSFDPVYATRVVLDFVGNPWVARELVGRVLERLRKRGFDDEKIGRSTGYVLDRLRSALEREQDRMAEESFRERVSNGSIQFRLRTDTLNWEIPFEIPTDQPEDAHPLYRNDGKTVQKSLFAPMYRPDFNNLEAEFACYLDDDKALRWWFRNVARQAYGLQGWRKHRVYPDFIFALQRGGESDRLVVIETKGEHLANLDTKYKAELLRLLSQCYRFENVTSSGTLELVVDSKTTVVCDLVVGDDWKTQLQAPHLS